MQEVVCAALPTNVLDHMLNPPRGVQRACHALLCPRTGLQFSTHCQIPCSRHTTWMLRNIQRIVSRWWCQRQPPSLVQHAVFVGWPGRGIGTEPQRCPVWAQTSTQCVTRPEPQRRRTVCTPLESYRDLWNPVLHLVLLGSVILQVISLGTLKWSSDFGAMINKSRSGWRFGSFRCMILSDRSDWIWSK